MDAPLDWDLLAVVRSCSSSSTTTATTTTTSPSSTLPPTPPTSSPTSPLFAFSTPFPATSLQDVCTNVSSSSAIVAGTSFTFAQHQQPRLVVKPSRVIFGASTTPTTLTASTTTTTTTTAARTKKRKSLMKKVCHVPAEGLSSDMWSWRKYGQKPIKGSPHPRGYYRCSSSKGCLARKQVERNRSNPKMFIVTYTSEHNHPMPTHRNSLAGSTRHKPLTSPATPPEQPTCSSPSVAMSESKTEGDNHIGELSDLMFNDDFYVGFEQIDGGSDDSDCFSEQFSPPTEFPWLVSDSSTATTAAVSRS
ncbi:hypothetical protein RND81_01G193300 [Saponaria officinalis]|uniref:WRKY domain-containing protein n=1 Tax=Saponaria officinalis TaxID=3572 RepID=A0AAW1NFZ3_SAPOF